MKKIVYYILPLLAIAACSKVQNDEVQPQTSEGVYSIVAQTPDGLTKTTISPDGSDYKIYWQDGDQISAGENNISEALSGVDQASSVTFTFSNAVSDGAVVRYPAVANPATVVIPAAQTSVGGQYDAAANPMWGTVSVSGTSVPSASVTFNNAVAMLKFNISGSASLSKAVIEAVGGQSINGNYTMSTSDGALTEAGENSAKTVISFSSPLALSSTATELYIPVRPQNYSQGFKLTLHEADGKYMQVTFFKTGQVFTNNNLAYFNIAYAATREPIDIDPIAVLGAEESGYADDKPANGLRIGSYNVWSDKDRETKIGGRTDFYQYRTWNYAGAEVGALVAAMDCDVVGFNEISSNMCSSGKSASLEDAIKAHVSGYTYSLSWPNDVDSNWWSSSQDYTFANGFIYKASVLTLNSSGKFWLNASGSTSIDSDAGGKRTCVWAKFTQKSTSTVFYLAVTHLSIANQGTDDGAEPGDWNLATAKNLISYLKTRSGAGDNDRIIIVGDMNASNTSANKGFKYIVNTLDGDPNTTLPFTDARDYLAAQNKLASSEKGYPGTSVSQWNMGSYIKGEDHRLDHIMFRNVSVSNYKSYKKTYTVAADATNTPFFPSDHLPISVDVVL